MKPIKTIVGLINGIEEKATGGKTIKITRDNMQYPDYIGFFKDAVGAITVRVGQRAVVEYTDSDKTSEKGNAYKDGVRAYPEGAAPARTAPTDADVEAFRDSFNPDTQSQRPTASRTPTDPIPGENPWAKPAAGYVDPTRASIEAQVALKEAGEFVRDAINQGRLSADNPETVRDMLEAYTVMCLSVLRFAQQEGK